MPHEQQEGEAGPHQSPDATHNHAASGGPAPRQPAEPTPAAVPPYLSRLAEHIRQHVDLDLLLDVAAVVTTTAAGMNSSCSMQHENNHTQKEASVQGTNNKGPPDQALLLPRTPPRVCSCRIAVARDAAFCFYYQV